MILINKLNEILTYTREKRNKIQFIQDLTVKLDAEKWAYTFNLRHLYKISDFFIVQVRKMVEKLKEAKFE